MSIRCGTSSGFSRREKVLRVTGAACDVANWATPQKVVGRESARVDSGQQGSTARDPAKYHRTARLGKPSRRGVRPSRPDSCRSLPLELPDEALALSDLSAELRLAANLQALLEHLTIADAKPLNGLPAVLALLPLDLELAALRRLAPGSRLALRVAIAYEREPEGLEGRLGLAVTEVEPAPVAGPRGCSIAEGLLNDGAGAVPPEGVKGLLQPSGLLSRRDAAAARRLALPPGLGRPELVGFLREKAPRLHGRSHDLPDSAQIGRGGIVAIPGMPGRGAGAVDRVVGDEVEVGLGRTPLPVPELLLALQAEQVAQEIDGAHPRPIWTRFGASCVAVRGQPRAHDAVVGVDGLDTRRDRVRETPVDAGARRLPVLPLGLEELA